MGENPTITEGGKQQPKQRRAGQVVARAEGKWIVRLLLGRDDSTGQRRYYNKTIRGAKKDADREIARLLREASDKVSISKFAQKRTPNARKTGSTLFGVFRVFTFRAFRGFFLNQSSAVS